MSTGSEISGDFGCDWEREWPRFVEDSQDMAFERDGRRALAWGDAGGGVPEWKGAARDDERWCVSSMFAPATSKALAKLRAALLDDGGGDDERAKSEL